MDTWKVTCQSCDDDFEVQAENETEAIKKAKEAHEKKNSKATAFRCDLGPMMTKAWNLTHPSHPCAPKEW